MKTIILARVSTEEQMNEGHSIPAQLAKAREYCKYKNLPTAKEYQFDESSIKDHREKFLQIIEEIKKSKEKVALIVETVDRLQRSFKESVLLEEFRKQNKVEIHFIRENLIIKQDSNSSEIQRWDLAVFVAKSYVLQISDNVKRSIKQKLANGELSGKVPVGYKNVTDEVTGKKTVIVDKERAYIVQEIFSKYAKDNDSINTITTFAKKKGLDPLGRKDISTSYIHLLLQNPFYIGQINSKYGLFPHKYPPLISREVFIRCQEIMKRKGKKREKSVAKPAIFRSIVKCPCCKNNMGIDFKKGKYIYLYCHNAKGRNATCTNNTWMREDELLEQIRPAFKNIQISEGVKEKIESYLKTINASEKDFNKLSIESLRKEYDLCQKRIDGLIDMKLDKSITTDDYNRKMNDFKQRQMDINNELSNHTVADEKFNKTLLTVLELARNASKLFESSEIEEKRQLIKFITPNLILEGKKLHFTYRKPFDIIAKGFNRLEWLPGLE
jgi:DNA invertase Pin-like site-specific DNA recombinase